MFLVDKLFKKSGMVHGIDSVTGKKVKDAFVDTELKKTYVFPKTRKYKRRKVRNGGFVYFVNKMATKLKDAHKLAARSSDKKNIFTTKNLKNIAKGKFMPSIYSKGWMAMHSGTLIDKRQETYLQSKKDIRWDDFKKKLKKFDSSVVGVTNNII